MPKFICPCGELIDCGRIPNPAEWHLISDEEFDQLRGVADVEDIYLATRIVLICPKCDGLIVFWNGFDHRPTVYRAIPMPAEDSAQPESADAEQNESP